MHLFVIAILVLSLTTSCHFVTSSPSPAASDAGVPPLPLASSDGQHFLVGGEPFRFIGANTTTFGFYRQYGLSIEDAISAAKANGISVIRIYLGLGTGPWGGRAMEEYDLVLDIASRHGMYVLATLTDCCCVGTDWGPTLETYLQKVPYCNFGNPSALDGFRNYIKTILMRKNSVNGKIYRDDTTIFAWDVMNEPLLQNFANAEISDYLSQAVAYVKSLDPHHLVTIGIDAHSSIYNTPGAHYDVLNVPGVDFFSFHYNLPSYQVVPQHLDKLRFRVEQFLSMGKPVVLEEFGVGSQRALGASADSATLAAWVDAYRLQMDTAFSAGASGVMFWGWGVPETRNVPLWWNMEDHDTTELAFCQLIREYQPPPRQVP